MIKYLVKGAVYDKPSQTRSYVSHSKYSPFVTSMICRLSLPLWHQAADSSLGVGLLRPFPSSRAHTERCYDSPWTGLLTSGDGSCHWWMAVGVRVTPLGRCNINRTIWEQSCQVLDMDTRYLDARHMIPDEHGKYRLILEYLVACEYLVDLLYK